MVSNKTLRIALAILIAGSGTLGLATAWGPGDVTSASCRFVVCTPNPYVSGGVVCEPIEYPALAPTDPSDGTCRVGLLEYDPARCRQNACERTYGLGAWSVN